MNKKTLLKNKRIKILLSNYVKKAIWDLTNKLIEGATLMTYQYNQQPIKELIK